MRRRTKKKLKRRLQIRSGNRARTPRRHSPAMPAADDGDEDGGAGEANSQVKQTSRRWPANRPSRRNRASDAAPWVPL
jgi:hypothetical protein